MRAQTGNSDSIADAKSRLQANIDKFSDREKDLATDFKLALLLSEKQWEARLDDAKRLIRNLERKLRAKAEGSEEHW